MTPYKMAWDKYSSSFDFSKAADPASIGAPASNRQYLENRLKAAFAAGWIAREGAPVHDCECGPGECNKSVGLRCRLSEYIVTASGKSEVQK